VTDWATSACTMLTPEASAAVSLACAVLFAVLVAAVLVGFGPLRARLGGSSAHPASHRELDSDAGLFGILRLHRDLRHAEQRQG
jgi:hypothetical protein